MNSRKLRSDALIGSFKVINDVPYSHIVTYELQIDFRNLFIQLNIQLAPANGRLFLYFLCSLRNQFALIIKILFIYFNNDKVPEHVITRCTK